MSKRPIINLKITNTDIIIEILSWAFLITLIFITFSNYISLPTTVPTHFNAAGKIDGYGNKLNILVLPLIALIVFIAITWLNKYPHVFNYPVTVNAQNALSLYTNATKLMRILKLAITLLFLIITWATIEAAVNNGPGLSAWFLPFIIILFLSIFSYFFAKFFKKAAKQINKTN